MSQGGSGGSDGKVELTQAISDPNTPGLGACSNETLADYLTEITTAHPHLADITRLFNVQMIGDGNLIFAFRWGDGFRIAYQRGSGDCPAGCINKEFWYFEVGPSCEVTGAGHFRSVPDGRNCRSFEGTPLWGLPEPPSNVCPPLELDELNTPCVDGTCPSALTPIKFYGVAGPAGPEFCWCSLRCSLSADACPDGTHCQTIPDGPGDVCYRD